MSQPSNLSSGPASMTGFGAAEEETAVGRVSVEVRSVNNRFLEIAVRLPREFNSMETRLRGLVKEGLRRGKVDLSIRWQPKAELAPRMEINAEVLEAYARQIQALQARLGDSGPLPFQLLLELPGVTLGAAGPQLDEETLWASVRAPVAAALERLCQERLREGRALTADLLVHLQAIARGAEALEAAKEQVVERYRERLERRIEEWRAQSDAAIDEGRLEAEVLFFADRCEITEELVRLRAHREKLASTLHSPGGPVGKALDFLTQEILRELNTIGAKARDTEAASSILAMKGALEKMREQIQNLE